MNDRMKDRHSGFLILDFVLYPILKHFIGLSHSKLVNLNLSQSFSKMNGMVWKHVKPQVLDQI